MGKTGGGRGTNQHAVKGVSKAKTPARQAREGRALDVPLLPVIRGERSGETLVGRDEHKYLQDEYKWIRKRVELDAAEGNNVALGRTWLERNPCETPEDVLSEKFLLTLHRQMLGKVWTYAGKIRRAPLNLGVALHLVEPELKRSLNMARMLVKKDAEPNKIAIQLHLDLVRVHLFMGGNGRHARMVAGELARTLGQGERHFSWGAKSGKNPVEVRKEYMAAVRHGIETRNIDRLLRVAES